MMMDSSSSFLPNSARAIQRPLRADEGLNYETERGRQVTRRQKRGSEAVEAAEMRGYDIEDAVAQLLEDAEKAADHTFAVQGSLSSEDWAVSQSFHQRIQGVFQQAQKPVRVEDIGGIMRDIIWVEVQTKVHGW